MRRFLKRYSMALLFAVAAVATGLSLGLTRTHSGDGITYAPPTGILLYFQNLCVNIVIATISAIMVSEMVNRAHQRRMAKAKQDADQQSALDLFRKFFGTVFGDGLLQEAIDLLFSSPFLRESPTFEYTFLRHPSQELAYLELFVEYQITNVGPITQSYVPRIMLPNLMADYPSDPAREGPQILLAALNGHLIPQSALDQLNQSIHANNPNAVVELPSIEVPPGGSAKIKTRTRLVKLINDADTMRMFIPTRGVTIRVINHIGPDLGIHIKAIHGRDFQDMELDARDETRWRWHFPHLLLPYNGWLLFWNDRSRNPSDRSPIADAAHRPAIPALTD